MIQGRSNFVYRINSDDHDKAPVFVSLNLKKDYDVTPIHVDVNIVSNDVLDIEAFKAWRPEYQNAEFILEDGKYICGWAIEKMSKSMFNVVNPDMIVEKYGADTLRLYEMFLGPVEASKPWDTNGIDGCHRFLKKFRGLFYENRTDNFLPCDEAAKPRKPEERSQAHQEGKRGYREVLLQHIYLSLHDCRERTRSAEVPQQGTPDRSRHPHRSIRSTHRRRVVGSTWRAGQRLRCSMAKV